MKRNQCRTTIMSECVNISKGCCKKFFNGGSVVQIFLFDEKALKTRAYEEVVKENPDLKAGIYIIKQKAQKGYANTYYVGETGNICARTKQHETDKLNVLENAENMIFISSMNGYIFRNISNRRILEYKFAVLESMIGHDNISKTNKVDTNDEYDVRYFFDAAFHILSNTIYSEQLLSLNADKVWNETHKCYPYMKKGHIYRRFNQNNENTASMLFDGMDNLLLLKGSRIATEISANMDEKHHRPIGKKFDEIKEGKFAKNGVLTKDCLFTSPYSLGCIVTGTSCNFTYDTSWRDENGEICVFPNATQKKKQERKNKYAV